MTVATVQQVLDKNSHKSIGLLVEELEIGGVVQERVANAEMLMMQRVGSQVDAGFTRPLMSLGGHKLVLKFREHN
jgi:hypothetical protein